MRVGVLFGFRSSFGIRISDFGFSTRPDFCTKQTNSYFAPVPARTMGTVRHRIFISSQSDQLSMYSRSSRTQSRKSLTLFRPLICQRQVRPGLTLSRRRWARSWNRFTSSTGRGRGPTRLISPHNTLKSWGNSSTLNLRSERPRGVMRGSRLSLNTGPVISFMASNSALNWSALLIMVRNL